MDKEKIAKFNAGLLSGYGGGDTTWWHNYISYILSRAYDHYVNEAEAMVNATEDRVYKEWADDLELQAKLESASGGL